MNKHDIIAFFDERAEGWDEDTVKNDRIIQTILDNALVEEGKDVLDVACVQCTLERILRSVDVVLFFF